jgi:saccharopine dehydrogenase-like NADP-dependent oxidoreductase
MVTAQYLFDELKVMDSEVKKKDLIFLNEIGLDPGLDHLATIKIRDMV